jgi:hypothetical protein
MTILAAMLLIAGILSLAAVVGYGLRWLHGRQAVMLIAAIVPFWLLLIAFTILAPEIRETVEQLKPTATLQPTVEPAPTATATPGEPRGNRGE